MDHELHKKGKEANDNLQVEVPCTHSRIRVQWAKWSEHERCRTALPENVHEGWTYQPDKNSQTVKVDKTVFWWFVFWWLLNCEKHDVIIFVVFLMLTMKIDEDTMITVHFGMMHEKQYGWNVIWKLKVYD